MPATPQILVTCATSRSILLIEEATGRVAISRGASSDRHEIQNVIVVIADKGLLCNTLDLAIKVRCVGSVLRTRDVRLRSSNRVEEDLLQSIAVGCRSHGGSIAGALALGFQEEAIALVELEPEGGGLVEGPAGDAVEARRDGQPRVRVTGGEREGRSQGSCWRRTGSACGA